MKILYVAMDAAPYSGRSHEVKVAEHMASLGHEVHLVVERMPQWDGGAPNGLTVQVAPVNNPGQARQIAVGLPDADVGFASSVSGAPILEAWKARLGRRVVAQVLDVPVWRLWWRERAQWHIGWKPWHDALYAMDALVANTQQTVQDLATVKPWYVETRPTPPTEVVYYGIDTEEADRAQPAQLGGGPDRYPLAVGVSRLVPYKGFDLAIAALSLLKTPVAYAIIGDGEDLWRLVQTDQLLNGSTQFLGGLSDAQKFSVLKAADFGLQLAFNRHIPLQCPMEVVYCGKPCIVADTPVNRERCLDKGVVYVNPADTRAVANAVQDIHTRWTPDQLEGFRQWVLEHRSFRSHADGVLRVLQA